MISDAHTARAGYRRSTLPPRCTVCGCVSPNNNYGIPTMRHHPGCELDALLRLYQLTPAEITRLRGSDRALSTSLTEELPPPALQHFARTSPSGALSSLMTNLSKEAEETTLDRMLEEFCRRGNQALRSGGALDPTLDMSASVSVSSASAAGGGAGRRSGNRSSSRGGARGGAKKVPSMAEFQRGARCVQLAFPTPRNARPAAHARLPWRRLRTIFHDKDVTPRASTCR